MIVPAVLLPRSTLNCWRLDPGRASLKLIALAELTAAVVAISVRPPRLTLIGPVRPVLLLDRIKAPGPVFVKPVVETRAELIVKLEALYWWTRNSPGLDAERAPPVIVPQVPEK